MPDKDLPLVSVIIPAYEGEQFLEDALLSVFKQTYTHWEVIVVDDGSKTENVKNICERHADRVRYIRRVNGGTAAARNTALEASRGEYLAFLDQDDLWLPEKIEKQIAFFEHLKAKGLNPGLVYTGLRIIDDKNKYWHKGLYSSSGYNFEKMLFFDFVGAPCSVVITREVLNDIGPFDLNIRGREDYDMWLRISKKYSIYSLDEYLTEYRFLDHTLSKDPTVMIEGLTKIFHKMKDVPDDLVLRFEVRVWREAASRFRTAAYHQLFKCGHGRMFREYVRKGCSYDRSLFQGNCQLYYLISYAPSWMYQFLRKLKPNPLKDVYVDVNACDLKAWTMGKGR